MPEKVLVVDDEPDLELLVRQKFRKSIKANEITFEFASDGEEALQRLDAHPDIGVVLTDINMPRMDGLTLLSKMRDQDRVVRAVVVSAYGDLKNIRTAMNRGAFDFVTKPINFEDLQLTVEKSINDLSLYKKAAEAQQQLDFIQGELDLARRIQEAAVPRTFPERPDVDLYAYMFPAREVGGDFYDFYFIDENRLGFVIGDVSGKGVSAAMFMTVTRTLLKALASQGAVPNECMRNLNKLLYPESLAEMFVTIFYGVLDLRDGSVSYCNAGHNSPYVVRADGSVDAVERVGGIGACMLADFDYGEGSLRLNAGDSILLYTDGVTEAMNEDRDMFEEERLEAVLAKMGDATSSQVIRSVIREVSEFTDGAQQSDDITALSLRYTGVA